MYNPLPHRRKPDIYRLAALKRIRETSEQSTRCPNGYRGSNCHCPPDCPTLRAGNCPDSD